MQDQAVARCSGSGAPACWGEGGGEARARLAPHRGTCPRSGRSDVAGPDAGSAARPRAPRAARLTESETRRTCQLTGARSCCLGSSAGARPPPPRWRRSRAARRSQAPCARVQRAIVPHTTRTRRRPRSPPRAPAHGVGDVGVAPPRAELRPRAAAASRRPASRGCAASASARATRTSRSAARHAATSLSRESPSTTRARRVRQRDALGEALERGGVVRDVEHDGRAARRSTRSGTAARARAPAACGASGPNTGSIRRSPRARSGCSRPRSRARRARAPPAGATVTAWNARPAARARSSAAARAGRRRPARPAS